MHGSRPDQRETALSGKESIGDLSGEAEKGNIDGFVLTGSEQGRFGGDELGVCVGPRGWRNSVG